MSLFVLFNVQQIQGFSRVTFISFYEHNVNIDLYEYLLIVCTRKNLLRLQPIHVTEVMCMLENK